MSTLLAIVDFVVLILLVGLVLAKVKKESPLGAGSPILTGFVALVAIVFAIISFSAYLGLLAAVSSLTQVILLVVLLAMGGILFHTWTCKTVA